MSTMTGKSPVQKIANRAQLAESVTLAIDAKAKQMISNGIDVVNFVAGEPDFDTPEHIKKAAADALAAGKTKYTAAGGMPELKKAICEKLEKENGLTYKPGEVLVSIGAKHSLFNAILTIVERGDQVIVPAPYWVSYYEMVRAAEGVPVVLPSSAQTDFKVTPDEIRKACTPKTVAVIINSPSNPTGSVYTEEELRAIAEVVVEKDIICISDEIYEKLLYDGMKHFSIAATSQELKDRTLVVNGFSKAFSMTGWRLGYCAGPAPILGAMTCLQSHSTSNPVTFAQFGAVAALTSPQDKVEEMRQAFDERRKFIIPRLNNIEGVTCTNPKGAFYAFPDLSSYYGRSANGKKVTNSLEMGEYLLEEAKCAVTPGAAFGADEFQRLSYANSLKNLEKGMDRIEEALKKLK
jgi:aspartate aminotransferase